MKDRIVEQKISVQKTARFFMLEPQGEHKLDLIVIHGYRQLASNFIKRFDGLAQLGVRVIAPEGLHRFYVEGYSGKVGASWMTKEGREDDIQDYVAYIEQLAQSLDIGERPLSLLGFSQGGPTACRWLSNTHISVDQLILHSSVFPNDFDFEGSREKLSAIPSYALFGDDDFFAPDDVIESKMSWMKGKGVALKLLRYKGGHEIELPLVQEVLSELL